MRSLILVLGSDKDGDLCRDSSIRVPCEIGSVVEVGIFSGFTLKLDGGRERIV